MSTSLEAPVHVSRPCAKRRALWGRHVIGVLIAIASTALQAQWLNYKIPDIPRKSDGSADLSAPAPRDPYGKPDLSGVWLHEKTSVAELKALFGAVIDNGYESKCQEWR